MLHLSKGRIVYRIAFFSINWIDLLLKVFKGGIYIFDEKRIGNNDFSVHTGLVYWGFRRDDDQ